MKVGIDAIAFDLPKIYLPIETLANNRSIAYDKLKLGLGLQKMSLPDKHQDVITFATNAALKLLNDYSIAPNEISRIYVGTESGIDSSKPIASFVTQLLEEKVGIGSFENCDVVDITFACIGAVDALQVCLDYIRLNPERKAMVISTDVAKYDLNSSGEYTQGAGAIAMLITSNPRVISFSTETGVSTQGVFDFFKPRQTVTKKEITKDSSNPDWFGVLENEISIYKEQPVFDGQYSNECYINRITNAYNHYKKVTNTQTVLYKNWENIIMHLPYCFQGRRTFVSIYAIENNCTQEAKEITKSEDYKNLVDKTLAPAEIASAVVGNLYSGSIFLALLSTLSFHFKENTDLKDKLFGFIAYGSGSKSKVFEGTIEKDWKLILEKTKLFETLAQAQEINFETYLSLHKKEATLSVLTPKNEFVLDFIEKENPNLVGARFYKFIE